jgi:flagellar basal body-associated protein FliL
MEIDKAKYRTISSRQLLRMTLLVVAMALAGMSLLVWLVNGYLDGLEEMAQSEPAAAAGRIMIVAQLVLGVTVVFAVAVGSYVAWYGCRAVRSERFPPPGSWIIEGRTIHTGAKARRLGLTQIVLGILMATVACAAVYRAWRLLQ